MTTETALRTRAGIEANEPWPAFAWPGGYQIVYVMGDGAILCPKCMNDPETPAHFDSDNDDGWRVEGLDIFYEGPSEFCAHCNDKIESAYGDPDAEASS